MCCSSPVISLSRAVRVKHVRINCSSAQHEDKLIRLRIRRMAIKAAVVRARTVQICSVRDKH